MNNDFSSIEKLVEFGLGLSVSQQMISTMNHATGIMMPSNNHKNTPVADKEFYAVIDKQQAGPFSPNKLSQLINEHKITKETLMWHAGMSGWNLAHNIPEINKLILLAPPPIPDEK